MKRFTKVGIFLLVIINLIGCGDEISQPQQAQKEVVEKHYPEFPEFDGVYVKEKSGEWIDITNTKRRASEYLGGNINTRCYNYRMKLDIKEVSRDEFDRIARKGGSSSIEHFGKMKMYQYPEDTSAMIGGWGSTQYWYCKKSTQSYQTKYIDKEELKVVKPREILGAGLYYINFSDATHGYFKIQ